MWFFNCDFSIDRSLFNMCTSVWIVTHSPSGMHSPVSMRATSTVLGFLCTGVLEMGCISLLLLLTDSCLCLMDPGRIIEMQEKQSRYELAAAVIFAFTGVLPHCTQDNFMQELIFGFPLYLGKCSICCANCTPFIQERLEEYLPRGRKAIVRGQINKATRI